MFLKTNYRRRFGNNLQTLPGQNSDKVVE